MISTAVKQNKFLIAYYIILLGAFFFLMRPNAGIPMSIRIGMMALCFIPVFFRMEILPFVVLCFHTISSLSFTQVLPSTISYFVLIVLVLYVFYRQKTRYVFNALLVLGYFLLMSLIHYDFRDFISWLFIVILLSDMVKDEEDLQYLFYAFLVISAFLSLLFLVHRGEFMIQYGNHDSDLERSSWINSNMFSAAIGAGAVLCVAYFTNCINLFRTVFLNVACTITLVLSFIVIILTASRGAFFAFVVPSALMLFMSKSKLWIKLVIVAVLLFVVVLMIRNNTFELLLARMDENTFETGGGRTEIWQNKLTLFFDKANPLRILFGIGLSACNKLGGTISTHNDFVTVLIAYGLLGLILFGYFVYVYPIKMASKKNKLNVIFLLLYVFIECCVLEPFFRGYIFVAMFYVFVLKYAQIMNQINNVPKNLPIEDQ